MTEISEPSGLVERDKAVLVTGGSRGIGRAIVLGMARQKARVAFTYASRADAAEETMQAAREAGAADVACFACDMALAESVAMLPKRVQEEFGRLDILVNNAGLTRDGPLALMPPEQWQEVLTINLVNTIRLTEAALPLLVRTRGVVVSISSLAGRAGKEGQVPYSATKAGIVGMTRLIARACRDRGVRAASVLPGFINTDMIGGLGAKAMEPTLTGSVRPHAGEPDDVAALCVFLAGKGARYLDGAVVPIDGGFRI